ncbi:MAG TPA: RagB/SusD family nutrient uptake outer membrane protein, partial [Cytophagales bacterium]|nr:RagB/SusD family nutrient uptake outer membrane protein [Cytophagales bacterium]
VGPLETDKLNLSRSSKAQVYTQIVSDFKAAASVLPEKGAIENGRATKGAALALLARAYMYQTAPNDPDFPNASANWQGVFDACEAVINSKKYDLEPKYEEIHSVAKEDGIESIFEIQNISGTPGYGNANEGTLMNVMFRGRKEGGWGFNRPSMDLVRAFEPNDPRLKATVVSHGDVLFAGEDPYDNSEWFDLTKYPFTDKYARKYVEPKSVLGGGQSDGPSNVRVIRYADVLLMYAEAANELGRTSDALEKLKLVRDRVKLPEVTETDKTKLREKIWHERRVELALENLRFYDLVRQGRAYEVMSKFSNEEGGGLFRKGVNEVFPIPETQIDLSNGTIVQNPGYN